MNIVIKKILVFITVLACARLVATPATFDSFNADACIVDGVTSIVSGSISETKELKALLDNSSANNSQGSGFQLLLTKTHGFACVSGLHANGIADSTYIVSLGSTAIVSRPNHERKTFKRAASGLMYFTTATKQASSPFMNYFYSYPTLPQGQLVNSETISTEQHGELLVYKFIGLGFADFIVCAKDKSGAAAPMYLVRSSTSPSDQEIKTQLKASYLAKWKEQSTNRTLDKSSTDIDAEFNKFVSSKEGVILLEQLKNGIGSAAPATIITKVINYRELPSDKVIDAIRSTFTVE